VPLAVGSYRQDNEMAEQMPKQPKGMPPVPPDARSTKGPGAKPAPGEPSDVKTSGNRPIPRDTTKQGRQGNIRQNTTNQGYQQDR
jgi:hypothetical protein